MNPCERATADFEPLLTVFGYFVAGSPATYLSAPINTGWRFIKWYGAVGRKLASDKARYRTEHANEVVALNLEQAGRVAALIRRQYPVVPLIDPTAFNFERWTQDDYRCFWSKVIERFAGRVIFANGWEASVGCVYEFRIAAAARIQALAESGIVIGIEAAASQIRAAVREMDRVGLDSSFFQLTADEFEHKAQETVAIAGGSHD